MLGRGAGGRGVPLGKGSQCWEPREGALQERYLDGKVEAFFVSSTCAEGSLMADSEESAHGFCFSFD